MHTFLETLSENAQFVLLCLGITAGVLLLAWISEKLVMRRRHRLNAAHTITTIAMLAAISGVSSIDLKQDEPGLLAACRANGWQARFYSAAQLRAVPGSFTGSRFVASVTGVDNVCERAALYGGGRLLVQKQALGGVTVAVAEEPWEVRFG